MKRLNSKDEEIPNVQVARKPFSTLSAPRGYLNVQEGDVISLGLPLLLFGLDSVMVPK